MGYYTEYTLEIENNIEEIESWCNENDRDGYNIYDAYIGDMDSCKWYEHEEDMRKLSLEFPTTLFTLSGKGEENEDTWIKYFKNGKMQVCKAKITYDSFDESKLK